MVIVNALPSPYCGQDVGSDGLQKTCQLAWAGIDEVSFLTWGNRPPRLSLSIVS